MSALQALLNSTAQAESGGQDYAPDGTPVTSPAGAMYAMQVMPKTASDPGFGVLPAKDSSPQEFDRVGKEYYAALLNHYGDPSLASAAYNAGPGNVDKAIAKTGTTDPNVVLTALPAETQKYVPKVVGGAQPVQVADAGNVQSDAGPTTDDLYQHFGVKPPTDEAAPTEDSGDLYKQFGVQVPAPESEGLISKIGDSLSAGGKLAGDIDNQYQTGQISLPSAAFQEVSRAGLGTVNDVAGNLMGAAFKAIAPETTKAVGDYVAGKATQLSQTPLAQMIIAQAQKHPELAGNLKGIADTAGAAGLLTGGGEAADLAADTAGAAKDAAGNLINKSNDNFLQGLVTPKLTASEKQARFARSTEQGILRSRVTPPTTQEQASISAISDLPISRTKSLLANRMAISDGLSQEAQGLIGKLKANDVPISDDTITNGLASIRSNLAANPYLSGNGAAPAERVVNAALEHISNNPQTASGLLQARKDLDAWVASQKGDRVFDPALDTPVSIAVQQVRQGINNMVDQSVPDVGVKASLAKQTAMYNALDAIDTKGANEAGNVLSRGTKKVTSHISEKGALIAAIIRHAHGAP